MSLDTSSTTFVFTCQACTAILAVGPVPNPTYAKCRNISIGLYDRTLKSSYWRKQLFRFII